MSRRSSESGNRVERSGDIRKEHGEKGKWNLNGDEETGNNDNRAKGNVGVRQEKINRTCGKEMTGAEKWEHFIIFQHPQWPGRGPVRGLGGAF